MQFQDKLLIFRGRTEEKLIENERYLHRKFGLISFIRRFKIPVTVAVKLINATSSDVILKDIISQKVEERETKLKILF